MTSKGIFKGAHNFVNHGPVIDNSTTIHNNKTPEPQSRPGLDKLLDHSMRDAFHDSSGRWPPPRCHYDSRQELRTTITDWGTGRSKDILELLLWMHGPFGVGKSAIAQSCAEALAEAQVLVGSLFFSRPNNRNDPNRVFTSLAYQLTLQSPPFAELLNHIILNKPTILTAALPIQFEELLVKPLRRLKSQGSSFEGWVVILDGLDEVSTTDAQCSIINIVVASIRDQTTPFRWFVTSRPEPHIQRSMNSTKVVRFIYALDLPLSPEKDHEILTFFTKELDKIGEDHNIPALWCTEENVAVLVKLANGLWVYVNTVTRFIGSSRALGGPIAQLRLVLSLAQESLARSSAANPLESMDLFYDLIMKQLPPHIMSTVRKILLVRRVRKIIRRAYNADPVLVYANVLGLSQEEYYGACGFLQSVLCIQPDKDDDDGKDIHFYHASFMEYMEAKERSKTFYIYGDCLTELQQELIKRIESIHSHSPANKPVAPPTFARSPPNEDDHFLVYHALVFSLVRLCDQPRCVIQPSTATLLSNLQFSRVPHLLKDSPFHGIYFRFKQFRENLPSEYRDKILRRSRNPLHYSLNKKHTGEWGQPYILGQGKGETVCWREYDEFVRLVPSGSRCNL